MAQTFTFDALPGREIRLWLFKDVKNSRYLMDLKHYQSAEHEHTVHQSEAAVLMHLQHLITIKGVNGTMCHRELQEMVQSRSMEAEYAFINAAMVPLPPVADPLQICWF